MVLNEANKTLRFLKVNASVGLNFVRLCEIQDLLLGRYFDGSWAMRRDGTSQGVYVQFVETPSAAESRVPIRMVVKEWASKKVTRVSRASLDRRNFILAMCLCRASVRLAQAR